VKPPFHCQTQTKQLDMSFSGCGFVGAFSFSGSENILSSIPFEKMLDSIVHRGPDSGGIWQQNGIKLGHRRLSILDLSPLGHQPMTREHLTIAYNGELYNFISIRNELEKLGYAFISHTDTEVIIRAYQEWGTKAFDRFTGMFAFALWDDRKQELLLVRDRFGIKPLYFYTDSQVLIFGSEVQALMKSGRIPASVNWEAVQRQIHVGPLFDYKIEETLVKDVLCLHPGEYISATPEGKIYHHNYYRLPYKEQKTANNEDQLIEELNSIFTECVNDHLVSDVPVAAFLSGGLDSSLLCAMSSTMQSGNKLTAITIDSLGGNKDPYTGAINNDLYYSEMLAKHFKETIDHQIVRISPSNIYIDNIDAITDLASIVVDDRLMSIYTNYKTVSELGLKVVLNGQGADEIMGGYIAYMQKHDLYNGNIPIRQRIGNTISQYCPFKKENFSTSMNSTSDGILDEYIHFYSSFSGDTLESYHRMLVATQLHQILKFEDYLSMQHSIECRVPFLDHRLVEWCFSIPFENHITSSSSAMGKMLLRKMAQTKLPRLLVDRPKQVFPGADESAFYKQLLLIFTNHKKELYNSEIVNMTINPAILMMKQLPLSCKELWTILALWRWEEKLKSSRITLGRE